MCIYIIFIYVNISRPHQYIYYIIKKDFYSIISLYEKEKRIRNVKSLHYGKTTFYDCAEVEIHTKKIDVYIIFIKVNNCSTFK